MSDQIVRDRVGVGDIQLGEDQRVFLSVRQIRRGRMINLGDRRLGESMLLSLSKPDMASKFAVCQLGAFQSEELAER